MKCFSLYLSNKDSCEIIYHHAIIGSTNSSQWTLCLSLLLCFLLDFGLFDWNMKYSTSNVMNGQQLHIKTSPQQKMVLYIWELVSIMSKSRTFVMYLAQFHWWSLVIISKPSLLFDKAGFIYFNVCSCTKWAPGARSYKKQVCPSECCSTMWVISCLKPVKVLCGSVKEMC